MPFIRCFQYVTFVHKLRRAKRVKVKLQATQDPSTYKSICVSFSGGNETPGNARTAQRARLRDNSSTDISTSPRHLRHRGGALSNSGAHVRVPVVSQQASFTPCERRRRTSAFSSPHPPALLGPSDPWAAAFCFASLLTWHLWSHALEGTCVFVDFTSTCLLPAREEAQQSTLAAAVKSPHLQDTGGVQLKTAFLFPSD